MIKLAAGAAGLYLAVMLTWLPVYDLVPAMFEPADPTPTT